MSTQLPLVIDPATHARALVALAEAEQREADAISEGESLAAIVIEMHRLIDQCCESCRAIIDETLAEGEPSSDTGARIPETGWPGGALTPPAVASSTALTGADMHEGTGPATDAGEVSVGRGQER